VTRKRASRSLAKQPLLIIWSRVYQAFYWTLQTLFVMSCEIPQGADVSDWSLHSKSTSHTHTLLGYGKIISIASAPHLPKRVRGRQDMM